jgi:hypothetical protein
LGVSSIEGTWADFRRMPFPPKTLQEKLLKCVELYPCEVLFVHRDAERDPPEQRYQEIDRARHELQSVTTVPIVPVRMTEAWLLGDEGAIRTAAGNPNGTGPVAMPRLRDVEQIADPKALLHELIRDAGGLNARRTSSLNVSYLAKRVVDYTDDFSHLLALEAFQSFQNNLRTVLGFE